MKQKSFLAKKGSKYHLKVYVLIEFQQQYCYFDGEVKKEIFINVNVFSKQ